MNEQALEFARRLPADLENQLVVLDLPADATEATWTELADLLGRRDGGYRLIVGRRPPGGVLVVGQWLADRLDREVVVADGTVRPSAGGVLYVPGDAGSGWVRLRPNGPALPVSRRFPAPIWEFSVADRPWNTSASAVADPLPSGVWLHRTGQDAGLADHRERLEAALTYQRDLLTVVLGSPGTPALPLDDVSRFWESVLPGARSQVRFVTYGPLAVPRDGVPGQAVADRLDSPVVFYNGLPVDQAPGPTPQVHALDTDGSLGWTVYARQLRYLPARTTGGHPSAPAVVEHRPVLNGLPQVAPGVYRYAEDAVVEVMASGLWLRPDEEPAEASEIRSAAVDPRRVHVVHGTAARPGGRMRELAISLLGRLDPVVRRLAQLVPAAHLVRTTEATASTPTSRRPVTSARETVAAPWEATFAALDVGAGAPGSRSALVAEGNGPGVRTLSRPGTPGPSSGQRGGPGEPALWERPSGASTAQVPGPALRAPGNATNAASDTFPVTPMASPGHVEHTVGGGHLQMADPAPTVSRPAPVPLAVGLSPTPATGTSQGHRADALPQGMGGDSNVSGVAGIPPLPDAGGHAAFPDADGITTAPDADGIPGFPGASGISGFPDDDEISAIPGVGATPGPISTDYTSGHPTPAPGGAPTFPSPAAPVPPMPSLRLVSAPGPAGAPASETRPPGTTDDRTDASRVSPRTSTPVPPVPPTAEARQEAGAVAAPRPTPARQPRPQPVPPPAACALPPRKGIGRERDWLRGAFRQQYNDGVGAVARVLSQSPGLRGTGQTSTEDVITDLVAARLYLRSDGSLLDRAVRDATPGPHVPLARCVTAGLGRLPSYRGATLMRSTLDDAEWAWYTSRRLVTEWAFGWALTAAAPTLPGDVDFLIWSMTARRTALLAPELPDRVLFLPGTNFKVLATRDGEHRSVLLRELSASEVGPDGRVDTDRTALDEIALAGLDRAHSTWRTVEPESTPDLPDEAVGRFGNPPGLIIGPATPGKPGTHPERTTT
ncbi:hypothetical protein [Streptomyces flaveolus]|uniref:hypothetical protein n=1 Tax=Streptomyces flaveolus TaxID=67297 RepID=UPI0036FCEE7F